MTKPHPVVAAAHKKGQFEKLDCGYWYWYPSLEYFPSSLVAFDAYALQAIAAELNRLNAEWDAMVRAMETTTEGDP